MANSLPLLKIMETGHSETDCISLFSTDIETCGSTFSDCFYFYFPARLKHSIQKHFVKRNLFIMPLVLPSRHWLLAWPYLILPTLLEKQQPSNHLVGRRSQTFLKNFFFFFFFSKTFKPFSNSQISYLL